MRSTFERLLLLCFLLSPLPLVAQDAAPWRGAWIADVGGERYVLYLVLRDGKVSDIGVRVKLTLTPISRFRLPQ